MKININTLLNLVLILVVIGLIVFNKSENPNVKLQEEHDELIEDYKRLEVDVQTQKDSTIYYKNRDMNWIKQDSVKNVEIENQKLITEKYRKDKVRAERDRKKAEKQLKDFKKNPPKNDDPIDLIQDTKKLIDKK